MGVQVRAGRLRLPLPPLIVALVVAGSAWLAGSAVVFASGELVVLALLALLFAWSILERPHVGAVTVIVLVAVVPRSDLFERDIPLFGGGIKVTDLLVAATVAAWLVGRTIRPDLRSLPSRPVSILVLATVGLAVLGVATALGRGTSSTLALLELRPILSLLLVFPLVAGLRTRRAASGALAWVTAAAVVASMQLLLKYVQGEGDAATFAGDAIRVDAWLVLLPMVVLPGAIAFLGLATATRTRTVAALVGLACAGGVFVTLSRGAYVGVLAGCAMALLLLPGPGRRRALTAAVPLVVLVIGSVVVLNAASPRGATNPLASAVARLESISAADSDVSAQHRFAEWSEATRQIRAHPVTGIGVGSAIEFYSPMYSDTWKRWGYPFSTYYVHNSYLWYGLKLGLPGLLAVALLVGSCLRVSTRLVRTVADPWVRRLAIACGSGVLALAVVSVFGPHLNLDNATPVLAALVAGLEVARRQERAA